MSHKVFQLFVSLVLALAFFTAAPTPQPARAAEPWYVATTGDVSNDSLSLTTLWATLVDVWPVGGGERPLGIAFDSDGNAYVTSHYTHRVLKLGPDGQQVASWGTFGSDDGQFYAPSGIVVDSSNHIYVADVGNHRIQKFDTNGTFISKWGNSGTADGEFGGAYGPYALALDSSGVVYVADQGNYRIQKFTSEGTFLGKWGTPGTGDGEFGDAYGYGPLGIAVDVEGNVYVSDYGNERIQKFTGDGVFLAKWGTAGSGEGQFSRPRKVAVDPTGHIYVVDSGNHRVQVFDALGMFVGKWGTFGTGGGQFNTPIGVAVDASGYVYVVDTDNDRIQKFSMSDVAPQPVAGFSYNPSDPFINDTIQFYDQSYDPGLVGIQSFAWDFGDGTTSSDQNPTHQYSADGDYTVQLTVTTNDGRTATNSQVVYIKAHVPPPNDDFVNATVIASMPFSDAVDNVIATVETDEPQSCDFSPRTVWYKFMPNANAEIMVNTDGSSFSDTVVSVYEKTGDDFSGLNGLNCISWGGSFTFSALEGVTYYIQAGSIESFGGELHVNLQEVFPPPNDDFANATSMSPLPFSDTVDTTWATVEPDESQHCDYSPRTVWYKFTPETTIEIRVTSEGSPFSDIVLTAYRDTGGGLGGLEAFTCVSWGGSLTFTVEQGVTYYIQAGYIYNSGELQVNLQEVPPPANDNFANATVITSPLPFDETVDAAGATAEAGEPLSSCAGYGGPYKSIWYVYTPATSGMISANVPSAVFAPVLAVYTWDELTGFTELGCQVFSGNPVTIHVSEGVTYYFQVSKFTTWDPDGTVQFHLRELNPPANDNFNNATAIGTLPFSNTVDITDATTEPGEPQYCNSSPKTVWYSFTPTENMLVQADMSGSSFWDTTLNVYQSVGPDFGGLNFMQCASYGGSITFKVQAGVTYYFQAGSSYGNSGNLQFNLQQLPLPPNDDFTNAKAITALPFNDAVDITNTTIEPGEPQHCYYAPKTVWYSFTPTASALIRADMDGSSFGDTILSVYQATGPGFEGLSYMQCGSFGYSVTFRVEAGVTYYIQAGSVYGSNGNQRLNLQELPRPANDDFADAIVIPLPLPFNHTVDTRYATRQPDEPLSPCTYAGAGFQSVWYTFTPITSGSVSANIPSSVFMPMIAVYTGDSLANLTLIECQTSDSLLTFHVNAGTTYYFQVGNFYSRQGGSMQFHLDVAPQPVVGFNSIPSDPSVFEPVQFFSISYDPGQVGIQSFTWDFGDGAISTEHFPIHSYAKDGDYTVKHSVTTFDGRTASISQVVHVKTHDVAITKINAPQSASAKQTRTITVSVNSKTYAETVRVDLYKSVPGGFEFVNSITLVVPARSTNRTTAFNFSYTFTSSDARIGKVTFKAVATIVDARDSYPSDNEAISSPPTKITK